MQTLFWRLLNISAKIIKIDHYNSELYRFKVVEFFLRRSVYTFLSFLHIDILDNEPGYTVYTAD